MSDVTYMMGVSITNKRTGEMFPLQTKAIKIDTTKIGRYMTGGIRFKQCREQKFHLSARNYK